MLVSKFLKSLIFVAVGLTFSSSAQIQIAPKNGDLGEPGSLEKSFLITWSSEPNAVKYEYLITDNPQCTEGCAGDTRQEVVNDTFKQLTSPPLQENTWYFWIVRVYINDSIADAWSTIFSFYTELPTPGTQILTLAGNPGRGNMNVTIDWTVNINLLAIETRIYNLNGTLALPPFTFEKSSSNLRYDTLELPTAQLSRGIYICNFIIKGSGDSESIITKKIIVQ